MLFPAYAGVILGGPGAPGRRAAFPRLRGGDPCRFTFFVVWDFFSPPTRG